MTTAKLTMTAFVTLDGVMQAPGGPNEDTSGSFKCGGWVVPHFDDETGKFMTEVFARADAFLLGRRTYEIFANHWPQVTDDKDPIATALNKLPKHVATKTLDRLPGEWAHSSIVRDVGSEVAKLKERYKREILVQGSIGLLQSLLENDLLDEIHLLQFPLLLGRGKRLFASGTIPTALEHKETRTTSNGIVIVSYARAGKPTFGTFELPQK